MADCLLIVVIIRVRPEIIKDNILTPTVKREARRFGERKMQLIESLYLVSSGALIVAGLTMVGLAIRAYVQTKRTAMVYLSLGFVLVVAAATATMISAFVSDFGNTRSLLLVNSGFTTFGYVFVVYSLISYE